MTEAVILAGGVGSRLKPVVHDVPKSMALVHGRPFVEWVLLMLRARGIRRILFCTGYKSEAIENYFDDGKKWEMDVAYSRENVPLGTAGALRQALKQIRSNRFLVLNGDSYSRVDVERMEKSHYASVAGATLWLVSVENASRYGQVTCDERDRVLAFQEKQTTVREGWINAGVYLLDKRAVESIPAEKASSLEKDFFPRLAGSGLNAVKGQGPFIDIGTPEDFRAAQTFFENESELLLKSGVA